MKTKGRRKSKNIIDLRKFNTNPSPRQGPYKHMFTKQHISPQQKKMLKDHLKKRGR